MITYWDRERPPRQVEQSTIPRGTETGPPGGGSLKLSGRVHQTSPGMEIYEL